MIFPFIGMMFWMTRPEYCGKIARWTSNNNQSINQCFGNRFNQFCLKHMSLQWTEGKGFPWGFVYVFSNHFVCDRHDV